MQTHTQQQQASIRFNQARACDLLQWQTGEFAMFIYERGHEYLAAYFGDDQQAIDKLSRRIEFWNWWKNEWNNRDAAYLHDIDGREDEISLRFRNKLYSDLHNIRILAAELSIPSIVYPKDFTIIKMEMA